ncbi:YqzE family protein [Brevibacillus fluminis]|uniref:YqzE family protein n=1 Tax=Brevibacillus fluminis TaxID=511487 RepID=A0A3M8CTU3_9BACL|nr:YqzE family protein [Brevibacillus fluminis]RNB79222.1 YqzE family protein [Brevibacillus fluminis]
MSFQEYLKYLTKLFVQYVETPQAERRKPAVVRETWSSRWFGVIPMAIKMIFMRGR